MVDARGDRRPTIGLVQAIQDCLQSRIQSSLHHGPVLLKTQGVPQLNIPIAGLQALYNIPGGQDCSNVDMTVNTVMPGFGAEAEVIKCVTLA